VENFLENGGWYFLSPTPSGKKVKCWSFRGKVIPRLCSGAASSRRYSNGAGRVPRFLSLCQASLEAGSPDRWGGELSQVWSGLVRNVRDRVDLSLISQYFGRPAPSPILWNISPWKKNSWIYSVIILQFIEIGLSFGHLIIENLVGALQNQNPPGGSIGS
jgi:hypothetical protein